jgi:hypothetical protein
MAGMLLLSPGKGMSFSMRTKRKAHGSGKFMMLQARKLLLA